jgi:hypothetical protein
VLIVAGFHVPEIALSETFGRDGAVEFRHRGPICANVGVRFVDTSILIVTTVAH